MYTYLRRTGPVLLSLAAGVAVTAGLIHAAPARPAKPTTAAAPEPAGALTGDQKIVHVLNRLGFGPRP